MWWGLFLQIVAGILGLWLAVQYIPGVNFSGPIFIFPQKGIEFGDYWDTLVFVGAILGFLNYFVKPVLKKITLPLRIITFDLFSLVILMFLVWLVDIFSPELNIGDIKALFLTTIIIWLVHFILSKWWPERAKKETETSI